ncbi:zinc transporter [Mesobaculum littorinae]|uniref:High-affinity zinc uptake system protein ZnuA n=1 Tax=Mesobaculum littorinae TaxID=2486419 RepID=A0A438AGU8_9RHOB|nr:zinc ABC transporter substrate-binding protein [Mesobaculum littorinae]RVV97908.1 zinc transporter [Mesobaculum littorinae]
MSIRLISLAGVAGLLTSGAALAEVPQVAADIAPVHSLVAQVMGDLGEPALVVQHGASPHSYALRPSEARALQDADAIFWIGEELEPWLEDAMANLAPDAETVTLIDADGTETMEFRQGATFEAHDHSHGGHDHGAHDHDHEGHDHDHDHDHDHEGHDHEGHDHEGHEHAGHDHDHEGHDHDHEGRDHAGHDHGGHDHSHDGVDPHAWLSPDNAKAWLDLIADELGELDPENAETYAENAEAGKSEIDAAVTDAEETLASVSDLRFVVFHDAYQYYETAFGLAAVGAISLSDASDPSPARIEEVRDTIADLEVTCVFAEPQFNQGLVRTVAEGTDVATGVIDPLGSDIDLGAAFYPELIREVANEIASCTK